MNTLNATHFFIPFWLFSYQRESINLEGTVLYILYLRCSAFMCLHVLHFGEIVNPISFIPVFQSLSSSFKLHDTCKSQILMSLNEERVQSLMETAVKITLYNVYTNIYTQVYKFATHSNVTYFKTSSMRWVEQFAFVNSLWFNEIFGMFNIIYLI